MAKALKVCLERTLPSERMRLQRTVGGIDFLRAIIPVGKLWMNGSTLRVAFLGGTAAQRAKAREEALWWTRHANLRFEFGDAPDAEIRVSFDPAGGAWSYVGTDCRQIPLDQPTMNLGFLDAGTAGHEFGHAIGLAHEHQNPAGGIKWNVALVMRDLSGPPNHWSTEQIQHNVLDKYAVDQVRGTAFDPKSIMLYYFPGSWVESGVGTEANHVLSALDRSYVASSAAYPRAASPAKAARQIVVDAARRTRASIGKPGEEDLYRFSVTRPGGYVIDTRGRADLVMRLYGPDSETALIAEDDNGGLGLNPRIGAGLVPGEYLVQIRHHVSGATGVGSYTVKVHSSRPQSGGDSPEGTT